MDIAQAFRTGTRRLGLLLLAFGAALPAVAADRPPEMIGEMQAAARVGASFEHQLEASGEPDYFSAAGLPPGISLEASSGRLSGVVREEPGLYEVKVGATNAAGSSGAETLWLGVYPKEGKLPLIGGRTVSSLLVDEEVRLDFPVENADLGTTVVVEGLPGGVSFDVDAVDTGELTPDVDPPDRVMEVSIAGAVESPGLHSFQLSVTNVYGTVERTLYLAAQEPLWQPVEAFERNVFSLAYGAGRFVASLDGGEIFTSENGEDWTLRLEDGASRSQQVIFLNDRFVAFGVDGGTGSEGRIYSSTNGLSWTDPQAEAGVEWYAADYGNGRYVVAGGEGASNVPAVAVSENGENWSVSRPESFPGRLRGMVFDGDDFVAIGQRGAVGRSSNGTDWTIVGRLLGHQSEVRGFAFGNDRFVAVTREGVHVSDDGIQWQRSEGIEVMGLSRVFRSVEFAGDRFILGGSHGRVKESFDGWTWVKRTPFGESLPVIRGLAFDGERLVAGGNEGIIFVSRDTAEWPSTVPAGLHHSMRRGEESELAVPVFGEADRIRAFDLPPGMSFDEETEVLSGTPAEEGEFVATLVSETAGQPARPVELGLPVRPADGDPPKLTFRRTRMLEPGEVRSVPIQTEGVDPESVLELHGVPEGALAMVTPDHLFLQSPEPLAAVVTVRAENTYGVTEEDVLFVVDEEHKIEWRTIEGVIPEEGTPPGLRSIVYADGRFVAVGSKGSTGDDETVGVAAVSGNGEDWSYTSIDTVARLFDVAYGHGMFIAAGEGGKIFSSPDGELWSERADFEIDSLRTVTFSGEKFLVAGSDGVVGISKNGIDWEKRDTGTAALLFDAAAGGGRFVLRHGMRDMLVSDDAQNWVAPPEHDLTWAYSIAYGNGRFVTTRGVSIDGAHWFDELRLHDWRWALSYVARNSVVFQDDHFIFADSLALSYSTDGYVWGTRSNADRNVGGFSDIASGGGKTVAVVNDSYLLLKEPGVPVLAGPGKPPQNIGRPYGDDSPLVLVPGPAVRVAVAGEPLELPVIANRAPDLFLAAGLPDGLKLDSVSGTISGTPEKPGIYQIGIGAAHEKGFSEPIVIELHVRPEADEPPRLASPDEVEIQQWSEFLYEIAIDGDDPSAEVGAIELPEGLRLDPLQRKISGEMLEEGLHPIVLSLSNIHGTRTETIWVDASRPDMERRPTGVDATLNAIAYGGGTFAAVGDEGVILTSEEGDDWTRRTSPVVDSSSTIDGSYTYSDLVDVAYGPAGFVAVTDHTSQRVIGSADGAKWEVAANEALVSRARIVANDVLYVLGGRDGRVFTSENGEDWTEQETPTTRDIQEMVWTDGRFIGLKNSDRLLVSTDAKQWELTEPISGFAGTLSGIAFGEDRFAGIRLLMSRSQMVAASPDSIEWTGAFFSQGTLRELAYVNGFFVVVGWTGGEGILLTSPNGLVWHERTAAVPMNAIAWGGDRLVGVGHRGIGVSPDQWPPVILEASFWAGQVGAEFDHRIVAGYEPEVFSADGLPPGVEFDEAEGRLFGTPVEDGIFEVTLTAANAAGESDPYKLEMKIFPADGAPPAPEQPLTLQIAEVNEEFEYTLPFRFARLDLKGLPPGLELDAATGRIVGTPEATGTYELVVTAETPAGESEFEMFLHVAVESGWRPPLEITSPAVAIARANGLFEYTIEADEPLDLATVRHLPAGFELDPETGVFSGAFSEPGTVVLEVAGSNENGWTKWSEVEIEIKPEEGDLPRLASAGIFAGALAAPLVYEVVVENADATTEVSVEGLPDGLEFDSEMQVISGAPGEDGSFLVEVTMSNLYGTATGMIEAVVSHSGWETVEFPVEGTLTGVAYGNGAYVVVALNGTIHRSEDGRKWQDETPAGRDDAFQGVRFVEGEFFAFGSDGVLLASGDGKVWSARDTGVSDLLNGIAYGNGRYVLVGRSGTLLRSADAIDWDPVDLVDEPYLSAVAYGDAGFVVTEYPFGGFYVSADADDWETVNRPFGTQRLEDVTYYDDRYWAVAHAGIEGGRLVTAADGTSWEAAEQEFAAALRAITSDRDKLIVVGEKGITASSSDGTEWASLPSGTRETLRDVAAGSDAYLATGEGGTLLRLPYLRRPEIVEAPVARGETGSNFSYSIVASGKVAEFRADGLPEGVSLDPNRGVISGVPVTAGTYYVTLEAENETGTDLAIARMEITGTEPAIVRQPEPVIGEVGETVELTVEASSGPEPEFQWKHEGTELSNREGIDGATSAALILSDADIADAGIYTVTLSNPYGETSSNPVEVRIGRSYASWVEHQDLPDDLSGPEDDPGSTGLPNLLAYFFGIDPTTTPAEPPVEQKKAGDRIVFTFTRDKGAIDVDWAVEVSEDLQVWRRFNHPPKRISETATEETWEATMPIDNAARFLRIMVWK